MTSGVLYWSAVITRFMSGQVLIQIVNMITGFLILRFLSIPEYAIYILASLIQSVAALGSDWGGVARRSKYWRHQQGRQDYTWEAYRQRHPDAQTTFWADCSRGRLACLYWPDQERR